MAISKTLGWILAGGAVLALGGAAFWLWRRRSKAAVKLDDEQPPTPEPDDMPLPTTKTEDAPPSVREPINFEFFGPMVTPEASEAESIDSITPPEASEDEIFDSLTTLASEAESTPPQPSEPVGEVAPVVVAKQRRRRYSVGPGELIELHTVQCPPDASWGTSRPDVEVRVVEQDKMRTLVALDGPAGEVNVALLTEGPRGPRPITSWKFAIVDKVA